MIRIGPLDLEKKAAIVATISEDPLGSSKKAAELGADLLEIRLDLLKIEDLEKAEETLKKIKSKTSLPVILTNRARSEGGNWQGSEEKRIEILTELLSLKEPLVDAVDIELSAEDRLRERVVTAAKKHGKTVIISSHFFSKTPTLPEMKEILENSFLSGADIAKLAVMPQSMQDVLDLLQLTLDSGKPVCTIAMGRLGKQTRIVGPLYGSALTYASVESAAAPGQLRVDKVKMALEMLG